MMRSLFSGVSGLTSHQTKMDVIGNNIANVNTYGFKGSRATFRDVFYQQSKGPSAGSATQGGVNPSEVGLGTQIASIEKIMSGGSLATTSRTLDMAIPDSGFFQVMSPNGSIFYTRAGNFNVDNDDNLVDSMGNFVLGVQASDPKTATSVPVDAGNGKIKLNVPDVYDWKSAAIVGTTDADGLNAFLTFNGSFEGTIKFAAPTPPAVSGTAAYNKGTKELTVYYDPTAAPLSDAKNTTDIASLINSAIEKSKTDLQKNDYYGGTVQFSVTGKHTDATKTETEANAALAADIRTELTTGRPSDPPGGTRRAQHFMDLTSFGVGQDGVLVGEHAVWGRLTFGRIDIASFNNPEGLLQTSNSYYSSSPASGDPVVNRPGYGGTSPIIGSTLEMSNVNLSNEFTDMITTQRGFQANSRTITVSDTLLEELINLKR